MRKILIVIPQFALEKGGASLRLKPIIAGLEKHFEIAYFVIDQNRARKRASEKRKIRNLLARFVPQLSYMRHITHDEKKVLDAELHKALTDQGIDLVIVSGPSIFPWLTARLAAPTILDSYDIMWVLRQRSTHLVTTSPVRWLKARAALAAARFYDRSRFALADQVWVASPQDAEHAARTGWRGSVRVVPNVFSPDAALPVRSDPSLTRPDATTVFFIGSMFYQANIDGIKWFIRQCWPSILSRLPHLRLKIAGKWLEDAPPIRDLPPNVEILGYVDDPNPYWEEAFAFICPLRLGTGTRLKILEAWARRVPVISTSVGIEGLGATHEQHALIADTPESMAQAVWRMAQDGDLRLNIAQGGHEHGRANFSPDHVGALAVQYCGDMLSSKRERRP